MLVHECVALGEAADGAVEMYEGGVQSTLAWQGLKSFKLFRSLRSGLLVQHGCFRSGPCRSECGGRDSGSQLEVLASGGHSPCEFTVVNLLP